MAVVKRCTITLPVEQYERSLELLDEAEFCFGWSNWYSDKNSKTFMNRYGQYYIAGQTRQSMSFMVSTYTADTQQELDRLASTLNADFNGKKVSIEAASSFEMGSSHISDSITETREIVVVGCSSQNLQGRIHTIHIQQAWIEFLEHYTPVPVVAHLTHYANIEVRIPHPHVTLSIADDFQNAAELAQLLQIVARSNRMLGVRALEISVESTILRLADLQVYADNSNDGLQKCMEALEGARIELSEVWDQRRKLADAMFEAAESQIERWRL